MNPLGLSLGDFLTEQRPNPDFTVLEKHRHSVLSLSGEPFRPRPRRLYRKLIFSSEYRVWHPEFLTRDPRRETRACE